MDHFNIEVVKNQFLPSQFVSISRVGNLFSPLPTTATRGEVSHLMDLKTWSSQKNAPVTFLSINPTNYTRHSHEDGFTAVQSTRPTAQKTAVFIYAAVIIRYPQNAFLFFILITPPYMKKLQLASINSRQPLNLNHKLQHFPSTTVCYSLRFSFVLGMTDVQPLYRVRYFGLKAMQLSRLSTE
jgi:hypothetical protein